MTDQPLIIERLLAVFGPPRTENPDLFLIEFEKATAGVRTDLLRRAVDEGMRVWSFFPRPAEVLEVVRRQNPPLRMPERFQDYPERTPTPDELARSRELKERLMRLLDITAMPQDHVPPAAVDKASFTTMQRVSRNDHLHRRPLSGKDRASGETRDDV